MAKSNFQQKFKDSYIPYLFLIFFAVFITVDSFYIYLAEKNWRGLATENGYQKGIKYNKVIEYVKKQKELGWDSKIKLQNLGNKTAILEVALIDKNKNIIRAAQVTAHITRPVQEGFDFDVDLSYNSQTSNYDSVVNFPLKGMWDVEIRSLKGKDVYQDTKRFIIQ